MAGNYDPGVIEPKWQQRWADARVFESPDPDGCTYYCLEMLPYPSGKIHMGHVRNYSIGDALARFHRMQGHQVMHVMGWDAFGLPAENAAIERGADPGRWTRENIEAMRSQFRRLGFGYDWTREVATCDPSFYRWNQWMFLRMMERGLAYRDRRALNWCDSCGTVLANEQVVGGRCWRCDNAVVQREIDQWFLRITDYAEELLADLDRLDAWPERVRTMQRNWIGRSDGARVRFVVDGSGEQLDVFTTRIDTIFGATYMALATEHPLVDTLVDGREEQEVVRRFVAQQGERTVEDRFADTAEKLGVFTGRYAVNPFNGERIPIWIANFVLMDVGTGAIMSVPAHDQRDFAFAKKYDLPIRPVIRPHDGDPFDADTLDQAVALDGVLHDSGEYDGTGSDEARRTMAADAEAGGFGEATVAYRLRDWGISRQRYWGTPIPVVHCEGCGPVGVPDDQLPVRLPEGISLDGRVGSPLAAVESFVQTECPTCGKPARRDTDTMDTFVDSAWYYFRYLDPQNETAPFGRAVAAPWLPVDIYVGGIEHATMHLIYTRFWTKVMRDLDLCEIDEPVTRLFTQGMVIKDGAKMSKSKGNVVDPDQMVERFGADTTRLFSLFAAPPERDLDWSEAGVEGCSRFLGRVWRTFERTADRLPAPGGAMPSDAAQGDALGLRRRTHRTIFRVTDDLGPRMHFNTAVSAIMELINEVVPLADRETVEPGAAWALREAFEALARMMAPFAPHFAEELWERLGREGFVILAAWPEHDPELLIDESVTLVVQVNGKLRGRLDLPRGADEATALEAARSNTNVSVHLEGKSLRRVIHVPDRLLNLVVG